MTPLPEGWRVSSSTGAEVFFSTRLDEFGANVDLIRASTPLGDGDVKSVDLANSAVVNDIMIQQAGFPARRIEGTAVSEGVSLSFSAIAIKPAADAAIIRLSVWGPRKIWQRPDIKRQVEEMLGSLKPVPPGK